MDVVVEWQTVWKGGISLQNKKSQFSDVPCHYLVIPLKCPSELADQPVRQQSVNHRHFGVDDRNEGRKDGYKRQAGRLYLHNAAHEKLTTSDEVLREELGGDMLDCPR